MHHALEIEEILYGILHHFTPPVWRFSTRDPELIEATSNLVALARTCRALKGPALDLLWRALATLSPLARCLPDASRRLPSDDMADHVYSFSRPLTETEWGILRGYARRIRIIFNFNIGLDWDSVVAFLEPPTADPLFPNLRTLRCEYTRKSMRLLQLPLPSLVNLFLMFEDSKLFQGSLESFPIFSPGIGRLRIRVRNLEDTLNITKPNYITRWQNLSSLACPNIALDIDDLVQLSRIPALTSLDFPLNAALPLSHPPLIFSKLRDLTLRHESLEPVSRLLSQTRLPAITKLNVDICVRPSREEFSFFTSALASNAGHTIQRLQIDQWHHPPSHAPRSTRPLFTFNDIQPFMAFSNLRGVELDIAFDMSITDSEVLALASAWPRLEYFLINADWGWNTTSGITPGALLQLLESHPSIGQIALRLDTRGYTRVPPSHVPASDGLATVKVSINVLDSVIGAESVPAITAFFCGLALACCQPYFSLHAWTGMPMMDFQNTDEYSDRWDDILHRVDEVLGRCSESGD